MTDHQNATLERKTAAHLYAAADLAVAQQVAWAADLYATADRVASAELAKAVIDAQVVAAANEHWRTLKRDGKA